MGEAVDPLHSLFYCSSRLRPSSPMLPSYHAKTAKNRHGENFLRLMCGYPQIKTGERTVQRSERGETYPPLDVLRLLADALRVPVETLIP